MDPILVDVLQLRSLALPRLTLSPGRALAARVIEAAADGKGALAIAGGRLAVTLPAGVKAGDELRLVVREVTAERVTLQIEAAPAQAPVEQRAQEREGGAGQPAGRESTHSLALRFAGANLGAVDLRFALHAGGAISVGVTLAGERATAAARTAAAELQQAIAAGTGADVAVSINAARPPLDVYV